MSIFKKNKNKSKGFSLIEILIVVAIVGILAGIAFPSYQTHIIRSKLDSGYAFLEKARLYVELYYSDNGIVSDLTLADAPTLLDLDKNISTDLIKEYWIAPWGGNDITIWFKTQNDASVPAPIRNKWPFYLVGNIESGTGILQWECKTGYAGFPAKYVPVKCR